MLQVHHRPVVTKYVWLKEETFTKVISLGPCLAVFTGFDRQFMRRRTAEREGARRDVAWPFVSVII